MFELADLKSGELLIDLGCGDGRIVNLAAKIGAKAIGIDLNAKLIDWAHRDSKVMGIDVNTSFIHGNLFDIDVSKADVVTMYLTTFANEEVRPKLEHELKNGARVVTHDFPITEWRSTKITNYIENVNDHTIFLYIWPMRNSNSKNSL